MISFRDFSQGLYVAGSRENLPKNCLRRAKGIDRIMSQRIRSRDGDTLLSTAPNANDVIQSILRFGNDLYYLTLLGNLYRHVSGGDPTLIRSGLSGNRIITVTMPPSQGAADALFVAENDPVLGGLFKVLSNGTVQRWGIEAPADLFEAGRQHPYTKAIGAVGLFGGALTCPTGTKTSALALLNPQVDLTQFTSGRMSAQEDYIALNIVIDNAQCVDAILLEIFTDSGDATDPLVTGVFTTTTYIEGIGSITVPTAGTGAHPRFVHMLRLNDSALDTAWEGYPYTDIKNPDNANQWFYVPKTAFVSMDGDADWTKVNSIKFTAKTNSKSSSGWITVNIGQMELSGGVGIQGDVSYYITYRNSVTGCRSNPNPTPITVMGLLRQPISLVLPTTVPDSQVDQIELWRTQSGGAVWFLVDQIPLSVLLASNGVYQDEASDYATLNNRPLTPSLGTLSTAGLSSTVTLSDATDIARITAAINTTSPLLQDPDTDKGRVRLDLTITGNTVTRWIIGVVGGGQFTLDAAIATAAVSFAYEIPQLVLQTEQIVFTNIPPLSTFVDVAGPINGRVWWIDGVSGRAYYSAAGLPESMEGYIEPWNNTDPITKLIIWNSFLFACTQGKWFQVPEAAPPFSFQEIFGAKGSTNRFSIIPTTDGIYYWAGEDLRRFNGVMSELAQFQQMGEIFRGKQQENIPAFAATFGTARPDELLLGDPLSTILALRFDTGTWREVGTIDGVLPSALFYDDRTKSLLAGIANQLYILEDTGVSETRSERAFEIETATLLLGPAKIGITQRIYIEALTNGQELSLSAIDETGSPITLPSINTTTRRTVEIPRGINFRLLSLRLSGSLTAPVEIYGIDLDVAVGDA